MSSSPQVDPNAVTVSVESLAASPSGMSSSSCTPIAPTEKPGHRRTNSKTNAQFAETSLFLKHKRRYCRIEGCNSIVKSQGLCQRHGAKPKTCKVEGCTKQAQGNFDKMCKAHFKAMKRMTTPIPKVEKTEEPPPAQGFSVYDEILPDSLNFVSDESNNDTRKLPLIVHLKEGFDTLKPPAWHRNEERRARGMFPIDNPAAQLEGWERELVWMEILVLTGVPGASFRHLARAWGRDKGFHMVLAQFICERHGDVERKKRHGEKNRKASAKKRRKVPTKKPMPVNNKLDSDSNYNNGNEDVGADVWDPSLYGDVDTNEALAAEIFDFTEKEFERVVSKYKQGPPSDSDTTDITAQAAMTAILGNQPPGHHRSLSSASSSNHPDEILPTPVHVEVTPNLQEPPIPRSTPAMEVAQQSYQNNLTQYATTAQAQAEAIQQQQQQQQQQQVQTEPIQHKQQHQHQQQIFSSPLPAPPMQQHPVHAYQPQQPQTEPMQQVQQQQQVQAPPMQHHTYQPQQPQVEPIQQQQQQHQQQHVQASPMQHPAHTYQQQQPQQSQQPQQHVMHQQQPHLQQQQQQPHQQQLVGYNIQHAPAPLAQEIQQHTQVPAQMQTAPQTITQQISTPMQQTPQPEIHSQQPYVQQMTYGMPQQQQHPLAPAPAPVQLAQPQASLIQQQQQHHPLAPVPAPAHATQLPPQPQAPLMHQQQQQQQQPYQMNLSSHPQHKQEQYNAPAPQLDPDTEFERRQLQSYETTVPPPNLPPPPSHAAPQQMVPIPAPIPQQQHHQLPPIQYTQTSIAPGPAPVELAPQQHQQLPYDGQHQQMQHSQMLPQQGTMPQQVNGQPMVQYPPQQQQQEQQQQQQEHMNHLLNHPPEAQDPLEVHHEMNATREDQNNM